MENTGKHLNHSKGNKHYRWNNELKSSHGYLRIRVGKDHKFSDPNGYAYEHLLVWVSAGNKPPEKHEILHHINEDKTDNRLVNLEIKTRYKHSVDHFSNLSDQQVRQIRILYDTGNYKMSDLADMYSCPFQRISKYVNGNARINAGGPIKSKINEQ